MLLVSGCTPQTGGKWDERRRSGAAQAKRVAVFSSIQIHNSHHSHGNCSATGVSGGCSRACTQRAHWCDSMAEDLPELPPSFNLWSNSVLKKVLRCDGCPVIEVLPTRDGRTTVPGAFMETVIAEADGADKVIAHSDHNKQPLAGNRFQSLAIATRRRRRECIHREPDRSRCPCAQHSRWRKRNRSFDSWATAANIRF